MATPTATAIRSQIAAKVDVGFRLCNAGDERVETQVAGIFYEFDPGHEKVIHPRMVHQKGGRFKNIPLMGEPLLMEEGGDPASVAANILLRVGERGVCILYGGQGDVKTKKDARGRYLKYRYQRARQTQFDWTQVCKAATSQGEVPPIQSSYIRGELKFLLDYEAGRLVGEVSDDRKAWVCIVDGTDFDTEAETQEYVRNMYRQQLANAEGDYSAFVMPTRAGTVASKKAVTAVGAPVSPQSTPPPADIGPAPEVAYDTNAIFARATAVDLIPTKEVLLALLRQAEDPEGQRPIIEQFLDRLAAVEAEAAAEVKG